MICDRCKFAEWVRTTNGRMHPSKQGRCTWAQTFRIAASATSPGTYRRRGEPIVISGGRIWRGAEGFEACDVFEDATR